MTSKASARLNKILFRGTITTKGRNGSAIITLDKARFGLKHAVINSNTQGVLELIRQKHYDVGDRVAGYGRRGPDAIAARFVEAIDRKDKTPAPEPVKKPWWKFPWW